MYYKNSVYVFLFVVLHLSLGGRIQRQAEQEESIVPTDTTPVDFPKFGDDFSFTFHMDPFRDFQETINRFNEIMRRLQENIANDTANLPENYNNTTTDTITIDGKKYVVKKTIVRKVGNGTELFVESYSLVPAEERRKNKTTKEFSHEDKKNVEFEG